MQETQTFTIYERLPGLNELIAAAKRPMGRANKDGLRWGSYSQLKREWVNKILGRLKHLKKVHRAYFKFSWYEGNRKRDPDNIAAAGRKIILDALVMSGTLKNDGWSHVQGWEDHFYVDRDKPRVEVDVIPL